ncbi:GNAT family N-acetyltransferase [Bradyrhizobium sp. LHD-71]|uniref:GNAT family N-acetyltransferase n=1 Tax=Bradyrhizobium sp. LHD-71 TaxID=3072141 RepID=UPI00281095B0|nr:GNAT family N-acetyltransferase [Bradyrhizobium sp. LHD-71]MDQ8726113.1 GNAT family N-acetyltransferase [Bradyrhizobium sp. LHD-71]
MTMAAVIANDATRTVARSARTSVASIQIFSSFSAVEQVWRALEAPGEIATPYQHFDLLCAWQGNVGARLRAAPAPVIAYDSEKRPVMVLPMIIGSQGPFRIARAPGGKHTNFNMALWRRDFATSATLEDARKIVSLIGEADPTLDVLALSQQPLEWNGTQNPLALLPHQPSVNECPLLTIDPKAPAGSYMGGSFRRKLNGKERKLQALPGYRYIIARNATDATRLLDAFFAIKPLHMAAQKIPNVFAEPSTEQFIRQACIDGLEEGKPAIELHGLECDAEVIAIFAGVGDGQRFSTMFNTYTMSEAARNSPGLVLIRNMIDHYTRDGYTSFDFGVGTDEYKLQYCKDERQPLIDSFVALSAKGRIAAPLLSLKSSIKRAVKHSPRAMKLFYPIRHRFG